MGWMLLFLLACAGADAVAQGALGDIVGLMVLFPVLRHHLPRPRSIAARR